VFLSRPFLVCSIVSRSLTSAVTHLFLFDSLDSYFTTVSSSLTIGVTGHGCLACLLGTIDSLSHCRGRRSLSPSLLPAPLPLSISLFHTFLPSIPPSVSPSLPPFHLCARYTLPFKLAGNRRPGPSSPARFATRSRGARAQARGAGPPARPPPPRRRLHRRPEPALV
jgi:hypothetical protein